MTRPLSAEHLEMSYWIEDAESVPSCGSFMPPPKAVGMCEGKETCICAYNEVRSDTGVTTYHKAIIKWHNAYDTLLEDWHLAEGPDPRQAETQPVTECANITTV